MPAATQDLPCHPLAPAQPWTSKYFRKWKLNLQAKQDLVGQDLMWSTPGEFETKYSGDLLAKEIHLGMYEGQEKDQSVFG